MILNPVFHLGVERQSKQLGNLLEAAVDQILWHAMIDDDVEAEAFLDRP
jgi:hypothetical protein